MQKRKHNFTSGATEANNIVVHSFDNNYFKNWAWINLNTTKSIDIDVTPEGYVDLNHLDEVTKNIKNKDESIISVMITNNETGIIQPIETIKKIAKNKFYFILMLYRQLEG